MNDDIRQSVYDLLDQFPAAKLDAMKQLFWSELNYNRANEPLSTRTWPDSAREAVAETPTLFATAGESDGFHIIYNRLPTDRLLLGPQRPVISHLVQQHPYSLFVFSNKPQTNWHFVNVRYEKTPTPSPSPATGEGRKTSPPSGGNEGGQPTRRVFRRITIGPRERLRTATERISMIDIATLSPDLFGLSPLAIQQRHDDAFDVEKVTKDFFRTYHAIFSLAEEKISGLAGDDQRRLFTQRLFNRLLFIIFLERKGWLKFNGDRDYLQALWRAHRREVKQGETSASFYINRLQVLFFSGLNNPTDLDLSQGVAPLIGQVPYLNGGLFEPDNLDTDPAIDVPDSVMAPAVDELLYRYNYTVTESTPLDIEVAVDPEMLGKIFEELVTGRHESGSYYTPKPIVAFMGQEALKGYLATACPAESEEALAAFVQQRDATGLRNPERVLAALKTVKICDPACGSGAYLLGMLHELLELRAALFAARRLDDQTIYQRKLEIIQNNLYGVDIDPFAVNIARLRLWLSLIVDFEGAKPLPLPNLDFKIEVGDSLASPDPSGGLDGGFYRYQIEQFFQLKGQYLQAHGKAKELLRNEIESLRSEIKKWAHGAETVSGFDWAVEFAEVFAETPPQATLTGAMAGLVNAAPGQLQMTEAPTPGGFDIVLANPPYVRADAQFNHIQNEDERQTSIADWKKYRGNLKSSKFFATLYEKWDLYIPFLERAYQLLRTDGEMIFIIPDAYNIVKYAKKSHEFFLRESRITRLDFCSDIPLFEAGVNNTILHFTRTKPDSTHIPLRFRHWGDNPDNFEENTEELSSAPQLQFGVQLFRPDVKNFVVTNDRKFIELEKICYISVGMVIHAHEKKAHLAFKADDLISSVKDQEHPKPYVEGKNLHKWLGQKVRFLEYGTTRAPALFRRPTFSEMYEVPEKLISMDLTGEKPEVVYDDNQLYHNHSAWSFVLWHHLEGVVNRSISKKSKYQWQSPDGDREGRERISQQFQLKYLLAVMNSSFAYNWLAPRRRSKRRFYPDDWKQLPIIPIPREEQKVFVELVDKILKEIKSHEHPLPKNVQRRITELEKQIDEEVSLLYRSNGD